MNGSGEFSTGGNLCGFSAHVRAEFPSRSTHGENSHAISAHASGEFRSLLEEFASVIFLVDLVEKGASPLVGKSPGCRSVAIHLNPFYLEEPI